MVIVKPVTDVFGVETAMEKQTHNYLPVYLSGGSVLLLPSEHKVLPGYSPIKKWWLCGGAEGLHDFLVPKR